MYYCKDCGHVFDEDEADYYELDMWSDKYDLDNEGEPICPSCKSLDIVEYDEEEEC